MKAPVSAVAFVLLAACIGFGQTQKDQTPKPGPEIQKLGYYLGMWKGEGQTKGGPFGPAGKLSSTMTCEWFTGGFQVVCRGEEIGPTGKRAFLNIMAYDQETRAYTEYSISNFGESEYNRGGSFVGGKLMFSWNGDAGGKPAKFRYTEVQVSPAPLHLPGRNCARQRAVDGDRRGQDHQGQVAAPAGEVRRVHSIMSDKSAYYSVSRGAG